jgi:RNA polymerase sigma-70 factor, ECF subfamily
MARVGKLESGLFEQTVLPHLDAAYNLARWLTRSEPEAEDMVQEAMLRALRSFDTFDTGRDARAWLLAIVRNCCRSWLRRKRSNDALLQADDTQPEAAGTWLDPEAAAIGTANSVLVRKALDELPFEYREVLVLRELEELSYKEISEIIHAPLGTVMSRLSRARRELYSRIGAETGAKRA